MKISRRQLNISTAAIALSLLAGCATQERLERTTFEPDQSDPSLFKYKAIADVTSPEHTQSGEAERMQWLRAWLDENNYVGRDYEIVSRKVVKMRDQLFGKGAFSIYYDIRIKPKSLL